MYDLSELFCAPQVRYNNHQSEARTAATVWNWSGNTLSPGALLAVLYFSSCHIFFRPFRLFLVPTICPWVSEDVALPTGRQRPTHPNSKPPALIPTLRKTFDRVRKQNCRETTSALEPKFPKKSYTRPGRNKVFRN